MKNIEKQWELQRKAKNETNKAQQNFYENYTPGYQAGYSGGPIRGRGNHHNSFQPYTRFPFQQQPIDMHALANANYFGGFQTERASASPTIPMASTTERMTHIANLKQVTACTRCGRTGHRHKDDKCLPEDVAAHAQSKMRQQFQQQAMSAFGMLPAPQGTPPPPPPPGTGMYTLNVTDYHYIVE